MIRAVAARATYADVLAAPPHVVDELIDGALTLSPRPGPRHADAAVFTLDGSSYRLTATHANDELIRGAPFEAIELELGALWGK